MPKEKEPVPAIEPVQAGDATHAEPTMTMSQVMELLQTAVRANEFTPEKMAEIVAAATGAAAKAANPIWWDERTYHEKSAFSYPEGNYARKKPTLERAIFWVGYKVMEEELRPVEIDALNAIRPGRWPNVPSDHPLAHFNQKWEVTALDNLPEPKSLLVTFPCKDADQRAELPTMLAMCQVMTPQMATVA